MATRDEYAKAIARVKATNKAVVQDRRAAFQDGRATIQTIFAQLFYDNIIQIILLYTEDYKFSLLLQNSSPHSLKNIIVDADNTDLIDKHNYKFIRIMCVTDLRVFKTFKNILRMGFHHLTELYCDGQQTMTDDYIEKLTQLTKLVCNGCSKITDKSIQKLTNLIELTCFGCLRITNNGIKHLTQLTILGCKNCPKITDEGIQHLTQLVELDCSGFDDQQITDNSIRHLTQLQQLRCKYRRKITDDSIRHLTQLTVLQIDYCSWITDDSIQHLTQLVELDCSGHIRISAHMMQIIASRKKAIKN